MSRGHTAPEAGEARGQLSAEAFRQLSRAVTEATGIQLPAAKHSMVEARLMRRARQAGVESLDDYCARVAGPEAGDEWLHLIDALTTNKTDFFREPAHFDLLRRKIVPEWLAGARPGDRFQVWSAACSTGEEPYTLAMVLAELAAAQRFDYRILATDLSRRVLEAARAAIYPRDLAAAVPAESRRRFLRQGRGPQAHLVRIAPELRQRVAFHRLNLMDAEYPVRGAFEAIFCRNVFIYFDRPTQLAVIDKLCGFLRPGGYLFLGHSESLAGSAVRLEPQGGSCYRKPLA